MRLTINKLTLNNFKGIDHLELNFNGKSANIFGDNRTGKTTIMNAWLWLLFGKDWQGRADYHIKPRNKSRVDVEVEAELMMDDSPLKLKRVYKEVWTRKRGSNKETFSGHTTEHFINDVPVKKSDYSKELKVIVNETLVRSLTDVRYFTEQMDWSGRRNMLMVLAEGKELEKELAEYAQLREKLKRKMRAIDDAIKQIPTKIDTLLSIEKELQDIPIPELEKKIQKFTEKLNKIEEKIKNSKVCPECGQPVNNQKIINQKIAIHEKLTETVLLFQKAKKSGNVEEKIAELKQQEKDMARQYEEIEIQLAKAEEMIDGTVKDIQDKINAQFEKVQFQLYEKMINGNIKKQGTPLLNGNPYLSLSNSERIIVGMDIIKTLQRHYNMYLPVFIDNKESITKLPDMDTQVICLIVSEKDKKLRIEGGKR